MTNYSKKDYFDFIFSAAITTFTILLVIGQIVFLALGLAIGIADWGIEGVLAIGFGAFGPIVLVALYLTLFSSWEYWAFDSESVTNGNLFHKRTILFSDTEYIETKRIAISSRPFTISQENLCFHAGKNVVTIPVYCLSQEELKWLSQQVPSKKKH